MGAIRKRGSGFKVKFGGSTWKKSFRSRAAARRSIGRAICHIRKGK